MASEQFLMHSSMLNMPILYQIFFNVNYPELMFPEDRSEHFILT